MRKNKANKKPTKQSLRPITDKTTRAVSFRLLIAKKKALLAKLKQKGIGLREYFSIIVDRELGK